MNLLSLRLDQTRKLKLRRYYYHLNDDFPRFFAVCSVVIGVTVMIVLAYGLITRKS